MALSAGKRLDCPENLSQHFLIICGFTNAPHTLSMLAAMSTDARATKVFSMCDSAIFRPPANALIDVVFSSGSRFDAAIRAEVVQQCERVGRAAD